MNKPLLAEIYKEHKKTFDALLSNKLMGKKEIGVHQAAEVLDKTYNQAHAVSYNEARAAFKMMAFAGMGKYTEGKRGHVSRLKCPGGFREAIKNLQAAYAETQDSAGKMNPLLAHSSGPKDVVVRVKKKAPPVVKEEEPVNLATIDIKDLLAELQRRTR